MEILRGCFNCKHEFLGLDESPCNECGNVADYDEYWEPKEEDA